MRHKKKLLETVVILVLLLFLELSCSFSPFLGQPATESVHQITETITVPYVMDTPSRTAITMPTDTMVSPTNLPTPTNTKTPKPVVLESAPIPQNLEIIDPMTIPKIVGLSSFKVNGYTDFAITPPGDELAVSTLENVYLFDLINREKDRTLYPSNYGVVDIEFSPDNRWLAAATRQGDEAEGYQSQIDLWRGPYWQPLGTMFEMTNGVTRIAFSPDSNHFASAGTTTEYKKNPIVLRRTYDWEIEQIIYSDIVLDFGFAAGSLMIGMTPNRYAVRIWDISQAKWIGTYYTSFTGAVNKIAFSTVAPVFASGHYDGFVRLWDLQTNELLYEIQTGSVVESLAFSPDGKMLASGGSFENHDINFWNVETHRV